MFRIKLEKSCNFILTYLKFIFKDYLYFFNEMSDVLFPIVLSENIKYRVTWCKNISQ